SWRRCTNRWSPATSSEGRTRAVPTSASRISASRRGVGTALARHLRAVPRLRDRRDELIRGRGVVVEIHFRFAGREVDDGGVHAARAHQRLLDFHLAVRARHARHAQLQRRHTASSRRSLICPLRPAKFHAHYNLRHAIARRTDHAVAAHTGGPHPRQLLEIYRYLRLTRTLEERLTALYRQSKVIGGLFRSLGQEGESVGSAYALARGPNPDIL